MGGGVRFILGRAGTGKSRFIQERIVAALRAQPLGPPIYLLVPRQATFVHERFFALGAGLEGYSRLRVVSFEDLGDDVIAECGGHALPQVSPAGRQMLIGHLLRTLGDRLQYFGAVSRQIGLVRELDRTFAEFERAGRSSADMLEALPELIPEAAGPEYEALVAKTRDLAIVGDAYAKALGADRLDATRRLERVMGSLRDCRGLREARLYVDAFHRFSAFERKMLAEVAGLVRETWVALTLDPRELERTFHESDLFFQTASTYRQLCRAFEEARVDVGDAVVLEAPRRFAAPALGLIERDWSAPRPSGAPGVDASAVRLIEAPDLRAEADAAARQVKDWTAQGIRLRDIAVLARDLPAVQPLLEAAFDEHELPFFMDRRRPAAHHPLVRFVRSLLRVSIHGWPHDAVMDLCKCGLAGMSLDEADLLENYALEHRIRGRNAWTSDQPWAWRNLKLDDPEEQALPPINEDAARAENLRRRLVDAIGPLSEGLRSPRPVREHVAALWSCLESFAVAHRLGEQIETARTQGRLEEAEEHQQAWKELIELLDQAVELLGAERLSGADFASTLELGLDLLDLAIVPANADAVILGDVERTRTLGCRAAVVIGMNEGTFPQGGGDPTVLSDEDRRVLRAHDVDVEPDGRSLALGERFLAYIAFTTPSERLTLTRAVADDEGRPMAVSPFWEHVQSLLKVVPETIPRGSACDAAAIATPRQFVTALMCWARDGRALKEKRSEPAAALYQFLATHDELEGPLAVARRLSWRALSYANAPRPLPAEVTEALYRDNTLRTSVSRLESFAACPFKHYLAHTLGLREREEQDVTHRDLGMVYHGVLERLIRHCLAKELEFAKRDGLPLDELLPRLTQKVGEELRGQVMLTTGRSRYLLERVRRTLEQVIAGQQAALGFGRFRPAAAEVVFGRSGGDEQAEEEEGVRKLRLPALEWPTPRGRRVQIHGQIDRIDRTPDGHAAVVIDYKLAKRAAAAELDLGNVYHGLSLQLLTYLLVLQAHGAQLGDPAPAPVAAFYVRLMRGVDRARTLAELQDKPRPGEETFDLRTPPRGVIDRDHLAQLDAAFADGQRLVAGTSRAYKARLLSRTDSDGMPAPASRGNDVLCSGEFEALLDQVRQNLVTLADRVLEGEIGVRPYRIGTTSACARCGFQAVCRFDPQAEDYNLLDHLSRDAVLAKLSGGGAASSPAEGA